MNNQDDINFANPMVKHYKNPDLNSFVEDGLTIEAVKQNARLFLSFPNGLTKNAIHNIMKQFGYVVNIHILSKSVNGNRMNGFVEYETFKDAEKALRELNNPNNEGLEIRAEFAHERTSSTNGTQNRPKVIETFDAIEDDTPQPIKINTINLNSFKSDDLFEKVTAFEFTEPFVPYLMEKQEVYYKKHAQKSSGQYNEEENSFEYKMNLKEEFLTFYCRVCSSEATLICEKSRRYFCTKECADSFNKQTDSKKEEKKDIYKYHIQKSDKVCLTAIINEKCVYVRPSNEDLNVLLEMVYRKSKDCIPLKMIPEIHDKVLVKHGNSIYRAVILEKIDENGYMKVKLTDIGNTILVNFSSVFEMTLACMAIKEITSILKLKNVAVEAINPEVIDYLLGLYENQTELIVKDIDDNGAELKENDNNAIVNEKIVKLANMERVKYGEFEQHLSEVNDLIPEGHNQKLFVVNISTLSKLGGICCVSERYTKDFHELYRSLNVYGQKIDPETYGIHGLKPLSLVKYNDQWHRAMVVEAKGNGMPECVLIDLQVQCYIKIDNIFQIPEVLVRFPIVTELFKIEEYDTNEDVKKYCDENIIENNFIIADKVEIKNDTPTIYISMKNQ